MAVCLWSAFSARWRRGIRHPLPQAPSIPSFLGFPIVLALHVVLGGVRLMFATLQFVKGMRSRHGGYHGRAGRLLVAKSINA